MVPYLTWIVKSNKISGTHMLNYLSFSLFFRGCLVYEFELRFVSLNSDFG